MQKALEEELNLRTMDSRSNSSKILLRKQKANAVQPLAACEEEEEPGGRWKRRHGDAHPEYDAGHQARFKGKDEGRGRQRQNGPCREGTSPLGNAGGDCRLFGSSARIEEAGQD